MPRFPFIIDVPTPLPADDVARLAAAKIPIARWTSGQPDGWRLATCPADVRQAAIAGEKVWLRGLEAGGRVSSFTALVLMRIAKQLDVPFCVDGLGTRAMAAALAIGAEAVVVNAALWRYLPLHEVHQRAIAAGPGSRDTVVLGELLQTHVRVLSRGNLDDLRLLERGRDVSRFVDALTERLDRWWDREDALIPAPQNIGEAARYGGARTAWEALLQLSDAVDSHRALIDGSLLTADPLGAGTPIVQGPMANVSERPGLVRAVADAHAVPFVALGGLAPDAAATVVSDAAQAAKGRPWGVGLIGFDVSPHREAHITAILAAKPPHVIIAGGSVDLALRFQRGGITAWLHTPSGRLASQALRHGVRAVVFEGHEAGGHVGAVTSVGLWEEGLAAVELAADRPLVVLAGGIGDATSAAFAAGMASAAALVADVALQAGTAFFYTHDIIEVGQLTEACQRVALSCERTLLVGSTVNLPLRCAPNAFTETARDHEQQWRDEGLSLAERRQRVEHVNLGRTRIAAKGIERHPDFGVEPGAPHYRTVPPARLVSEGAFTLGQGATVQRGLTTVRALVAAFTVDAAKLLANQPRETLRWAGAAPVIEAVPPGAPKRVSAVVSMRPQRPTNDAPIAIVGMGCVLPGASDLATYWQNLVTGVDAIGTVPDKHWTLERYWDPATTPRGPERSRSRFAGHIGEYAFDPLAFRIPPRVAATMDETQKLALVVAEEALRNAGLFDANGQCTVDGERAAVVLGNSMGGTLVKSLALRVRVREVLDAVQASGALIGDIDAVADALSPHLQLPPLTTNSIAGSLANVIAGRITQWLDWHGGTFTVDAACGSSLAALQISLDGLRSGRFDTVITGGVDADLSPEAYVGFSLAGALSSDGSRPFQSGADGFIMGEGAAALVLMRLDDAVARNLPVWAVIRGVGTAADGRGRGITAPRADGQRRAISRAWADAGLEPRTAGMVEAHGTGTTLGDRVEAEVLQEQFGGADHASIWLGSVKSMLGHLKGAAGAASLVKTALALATGVVPPTLHAGPIEPELKLADGPFRLPQTAAVFAGSPRRAGVSAFGFGGTNFHAVLEQAPVHARVPEPVAAFRAVVPVPPSRAWPWEADPRTHEVLAWGAETPAELLHAVLRETPQPALGVASQSERLTVVSTRADRELTIGRVYQALASGAGAGDGLRGSGPPEPLVVLVPGQGVDPRGALTALQAVPAATAVLDRCATLLQEQGRDLAHDAEHAADDITALHVLSFVCAAAWGAVLAKSGTPLRAVLGHSLGEYGALHIAGRLPLAGGLRLVIARGEALQACSEGAMAALAVDEAGALALAGPDLAIAAVNGARSTVVSGSPGGITALLGRARAAGITAVALPVRRAYHSPLVEPARERLRAALAAADFTPGHTPCWSTTLGTEFPADLRDILANALVSTVRFYDTAMAVGGPWVEVGPGKSLSRHLPGALALDPTPGTAAGALPAAGALLALGWPGLCDVESLPTPKPAPVPKKAIKPQEPVIVVRGPKSERDPIRAEVIAAIAEVTGYPAAFVASAGGDLEGALGIDSIRRLEILGTLQERLGFASDDADAASLAGAGLEQLIDYVAARRRAEPAIAKTAGPRTVGFWQPLQRPIPAAAPAAVHDPDFGVSEGPSGRVWRVEPMPRRLGPQARTLALLGLSLAKLPPKPLAIVIDDADAAAWAAIGFARSLVREQGVPLRVVRVSGDMTAGAIGSELAAAGRPPTVVLSEAATTAESFVPTELPALSLRHGAVILATGGLTGIVGQALTALVDLAPRIWVVGRRTDADVAPLQAAGLSVTYVPVDIGDVSAVQALVARIRATDGPVDLLLHGAGVLRDRWATELTADDVSAVFYPKVDGLDTLLEALHEAPPRVVAFSSLTAEGGQPGQSLYGAANAILDAQSRTTGVSMLWTAWSDVGMAAPLAKFLTSRGVTPLPPAIGAAAFRAALGAKGRVAISADALGEPFPSPLAAWMPPTGFRIHLDPSQPALQDHRVGGRVLVPAVTWLSAMVHALAYFADWPGELRAFTVLAPTFVEQPRRDISLALTPCSDGFTIVIGSAVPLASAQWGSVPSAIPEYTPVACLEDATPLYRPDVWFHGRTWQQITHWGHSGADISGTLAPSAQPPVMALDAAWQLLSLWLGRQSGWLGLPTGFSSLAVSAEPAVVLHLHAILTSEGASAAVVGLSAAGEVALHALGLRIRKATPFPLPRPS